MDKIKSYRQKGKHKKQPDHWIFPLSVISGTRTMRREFVRIEIQNYS
jgi:hypothetical protein